MTSSNFLRETLAAALPRILTQCCRDAGCPAYGCFDRNWWHYRIRDFASTILQQGGYTVLRASEALPGTLPPEFARSIAAGSARFWNRRATRHGAFEEYYPWEQGYPPVAFSTLAIAKLVAEGVADRETVRPGMKIAARQLLTRFEAKATNQQVAGLAALAWVRRSYPDFVSAEGFAAQKAKTLARQSEEGWFWEYDGPDAGYLSVTMDCLWDLFDATGDADFRTSCDKALGFLDATIGQTGCGLGMLNARNTDYVVPYGIARYLNDGTDEQKRQAARLLDVLYGGTADGFHFFQSVDDRYWCHYIGHSVARGILELDKANQGAGDWGLGAGDKRPPDLPQCGYYFRVLPNGMLLTMAMNKGGSLRLTKDGKVRMLDFGWIVDDGKKLHVTHWWSLDRKCLSDEDKWCFAAPLAPHKEVESTPFMHMGLRFVSFVFGKSIIGLLKNVMIFKKKHSPYCFERRVHFLEDGSLRVEDAITGLPANAKVLPAPRASKRHVASADSFHPEDTGLVSDAISMERTEKRGENNLSITTLYRFKG